MNNTHRLATALLLACMPTADIAGDDAPQVTAHVFAHGAAPLAVGSPTYLASVSLGQSSVAASPVSSSGDEIIVETGYQAATAGFEPGYDGRLDSVGNHLPDIWEWCHFGGLGLAPAFVNKRGYAVPTADVHVWGLNPHDEDAVLEFASLQSGALGPALSFMSSLGRQYAILTRTNLMDGGWVPLPDHEDIPGTGGIIEADDEAQDDHPLRFYRIRVSLP